MTLGSQRTKPPRNPRNLQLTGPRGRGGRVLEKVQAELWPRGSPPKKKRERERVEFSVGFSFETNQKGGY